MAILSCDRIKKLSMYGFSIVETPNRKSFVLAHWLVYCYLVRETSHHITVLGIDADFLRGDILSCYGGLDSHLPKRE